MSTFKRLRRRRLEGELSDADLHRQALAGSAEAITALYRRHGGLVYRFTLCMSRDAAVAEEITQEVFLALLSRLERFDPARGALSTWLCAIARRQLWKHLERNATADLTDEGEDAELVCPKDGPAELLLRQEAVAAVQAALDELPAALREVTVLCSLEEMSYDEAAAVLGVPVGTVRSRLSRAKARLAGVLRGEALTSEGERR